MDRNLLLGVLAAAAAALIGAGWQITVRHGVTTSLGPIEIAWLRYGLPTLLLAPFWLRTAWPPIAPRLLLLMVLTGGLPFGLLVLAGAQYAPAAHLGIFMAGTMPLFTAVLCWLALREPVRGWRWVGLAVIAAGVFTLGRAAWGGGAGSWRGDVLFLLAAAIWAVFTIALRRSGLGPWQATVLVNGGSLLLLVVLLPWFAAPRLFTAPWPDVVLQAAYQGVLAGVLGQVAYIAAVARLGAARAALSSAVVPLLTATGAALILREPLDTATLAASVLVMVGIALAALPSRAVPAPAAAPARDAVR